MAIDEHTTSTTRPGAALRRAQRPWRGMRLGVLGLFVLGLIGFGGGIAAPASAGPPKGVYICKQAAVGSGVTGTFAFTVRYSRPDYPQVPPEDLHAEVPVGGCTFVTIGGSDVRLVITETLKTGVVVKSITAVNGDPGDENASSTTNLSTGSITIEPDPDSHLNKVMVNQKNEKPPFGTVTFTNGDARPCMPKVTIWTKAQVKAIYDKTGCRVLKIKGKGAFIYENSYYVAGSAKPCPDGSFDGTGCSFGNMPPNGFIYNNAFYVTTLLPGTCPMVGTIQSKWDGANCFIMAAAPGTSAFTWAGKWGTTRPGTCPSLQGTWDGAHCYVGTAPLGHKAFISGGYFYYEP